MTYVSKIALAAAAVVAFGSAANAADAILPVPVPPVVVPPAAPAFDWSGFYAGVNLGYAFGQGYDENGDVLVDFNGNSYDSINGLIGGVQVGSNFQFDGFVLGIEGDLQHSDAFQDEGDVAVALNYFGTVRARAGVALDAFMPYVTGGLAFGEGTIYAGGDDWATSSHIGWTAGAGVEAAVTDDMSIKAEYLYTDLGTQTYTFENGLYADEDAGLNFHTVRVGLNWHF